MPKTIFIIVPTFKEPQHVQTLIDDLLQQRYRAFKLYVVNCNPGDQTSDLIETIDDKRIFEIPGDSSLFWTGAIELGQRAVADEYDKTDFVQLLNCDIRLDEMHLSNQLAAMNAHPHSMVCPVTIAGDHLISSGCKMRSWSLAWAEHFLRGKADSIGNATSREEFIPADMLVGRALIGPATILKDVGFVNSRKLPHYCADYEYSARAKKNGYNLFVATRYQISNDDTNSGIKSESGDNTLFDRVKALNSIRSPLNLKLRIRFITMTYPIYAIPSGVLINVCKVFAETLMGRHLWTVLKYFRS